MPEQVHDCVESVLQDNPDYSESRAWAICRAEMEAKTDDVEVAGLDEVDVDAESLDALAQESREWTRHDCDDAVAWIDTEGGTAVYEAADQQADGFGVDVYRIVQPDEEGPAEPGDLLGVAVGMPNAGVYVDWNIDAWPDDEQLSGAHVSDYDNLDDLEQVTAGDLEAAESVTVDQQAKPDGGAVVQSLSQEAAQVDAVALSFPPGGEVIDHEAGDWGGFLNDLSAHGDVFQMWEGLQRHPEDDLESHDHTTYVALEAGSDVSDIESVLGDHPAVNYTIDAGSVGAMDRPDDWNPEETDLYHNTDDVEQQAAADHTLVIQGLSQEGRDALERKYNATILEETDE